jgi:hypothetical protein
MDENDSTPAPSDGTSCEPAGSTPRSARSVTAASPVGRSRHLVFGLVAGLIAGVASLLVGEMILIRYQHDLLPTLRNSPSAEQIRRLRDARLYSATLTYTTMAGFLGMALGWAGGMARWSLSASVRAAILGLLLGTAATASMALGLVPNFYKRYDPQSGDLVLPLLTHGAIWSTVGAIGGLAFGLGLGGKGRWKATLVGGLAGAGAATIIYEIVGALAFASSHTDLPLSSSITTRGMAQLLVAILSAVGAVWAWIQPSKSDASSSVHSRGTSGLVGSESQEKLPAKTTGV